jgi:hypothetical protein
MKIEELRIGNLFLDYKGEPIKVTHKVFADIASGGWKDAKYMPLSDDILIKMGFSDAEYKPGYIGIDINHTDFTLTKPQSESFDVTLKNYSFHCSYGGWPRFKQFEFVHDLQNFFFALHGKDLKTDWVK